MSYLAIPGDAVAATKAANDAPTLSIRRLHPQERDLLLAHLMRLDAEARRLRFGNPVNDHFLERYAALALGADALIMGLFADGVLRGVAELRYLIGSRNEAEGAFSIEKAFQGLGFGDRLFGRLIASARNRGVRRLFLTCLRENRRMQAIAAKHGADLSFVAGDVTAEIRRPYADAASITEEWADESEAFVFAMIDWRRNGFDFVTWPLQRLAESLNPSSLAGR
ncbi:GNAT family N-acetyltransferase [Aurantimonas aggregata]|uniref:GNAT family N-acetyltransferase n=1 Tax=Aurantimonas aggregata TaxID=2047720 RepID=A0A6L9MIE3_9HYPH|nr:GNAT family N-acetyltransferase [Aurantimonas aggregata]NDV87481.1 GNAT family N-acetyltransferase [Aurantimonas aggregata]